jgi:hypothetical protein
METSFQLHVSVRTRHPETGPRTLLVRRLDAPFEWALQSDFVEGRELSMFEAYLLNRRNMDQPFVVKALNFPAPGTGRLSWLSDGLPHGKVTVRTTPDLTLHQADWSVLIGTLSHHGQGTSFGAGSPPVDEGRIFFRVEVSE